MKRSQVERDKNTALAVLRVWVATCRALTLTLAAYRQFSRDGY